MKPDSTSKTKPATIRNRITLVGVVLACSVFVLQTVLVIVDVFRGHGHPYPFFRLVTYLIVPMALVGCILLAIAGVIFHRWRLRRRGIPLPHITITGRANTLQWIGILILFGTVITAGAVTLYRAYHFTESVEFCGLVCHGVMKPEYTTFQDSPHSSMTCTECHIGPGAKAFVEAKISGLYEVYSLAFDKYHRPIDPPVKNLRPARETCRTCHWPQKFFGAVLRTWTYYRTDEENSPWSIKMLLKTGGGDPRHGPVQGFHWHMEGVNDVDYITTDDRRLEIPWVRMTDQNGKVTVFQTTDEDKRLTKEQIASMSKRPMDCMDCHNRPTHTFLSPNEALDMAMLSGKIDPAIPEIKSTAGSLLEGKYETEGEALAAIDGSLRKKCEGAPNLDSAIEEVQRIYQRNFFPEMKVRWDAYPDHSGHKITPGCFRCHDGQHVSESGEVIRRDCEICHVIIAQGPGTEPDGFTPHGLEFEHPEDIDDEWKTERCDTCHTGAP